MVGVGSVGTRAWIVLLLGRDGQDPLFLQAKEAQASVLERFVGRSKYPNHGQRVVAGQRLMQAASDIFLGLAARHRARRAGRDFYLRQLRDWKGSADIENMASEPDGRLRPDLRLDPRPCPCPFGRPDRDRRPTSGTSDTFDRAIADFSVAYADQNERDHQALIDAVASGRLEAHTGL